MSKHHSTRNDVAPSTPRPPVRPAEPVAPPPRGPARWVRHPVLLGVGLALPLVVFFGAGLILILLAFPKTPVTHSAPSVATNSEPPSVPLAVAPPPAAPAAPPTRPVPEPPTPPIEDVLKGYIPAPQKPPEVRAGTLPPELQAKVNTAIDQGVGFLKECVEGRRRDTWLPRPGGAALAGLTLLSCGVPAEDPSAQKLVARLRSSERSLADTYGLSLAILFLDRLGDAKDHDLIRTLTLRLVAGQNAAGGWTYTCPALSTTDQEQFLNLLDSLPPPVDFTAVTSDPDAERPAAPSQTPAPDRKKLSPALRKSGVLQVEPSRKLDLRGGGDNSNTQFALLAVWAAKKHGVPVDRTLALAEARFRAGQNGDGSWGYHSPGKVRPESMTCAGLLGLAVGRGTFGARAKSQEKDEAITRGLDFLAKGIGRAEKPAGPRRGGAGSLVGADSLGDLYYLWSVERVAVAYDLQTFDGKDWYRWGAELLVEHQKDDGSWADAYPGVPDTCFALLFLKRANVAQDLTVELRAIDNLFDRGDVRHKRAK